MVANGQRPRGVHDFHLTSTVGFNSSVPSHTMERRIFPSSLPERPDQHRWPRDIEEAFGKMESAYHNAVRLIRNEDGEPLDLRARSQILRFQIIPILQALENSMPNYPNWISQCAEAIMSLSVDLMMMAQSLETMYLAYLSNKKDLYW